MPYESPYATPKPAAPADAGLRRRLPAIAKMPVKKKPEAGGLLGAAATAIKNRKKLLDSL